MRHRLIHLLLLFILPVTHAFADSQIHNINAGALGLLKIITETAPNQPMTLIMSNNSLLTITLPYNEPAQLHIKPLSIDKSPIPMMLVATSTAGGDHDIWSYSIIGKMNNQLKLLTVPILSGTDTSKMIIGYFTKTKLLSLALLNVNYDDDALRADPHKISIHLYRWNDKTSQFIKTKDYLSKNRYSDAMDALAELKIADKTNILENFPTQFMLNSFPVADK